METGADLIRNGLIAGALIAVGVFLAFRGRRKKN
jgi:LPXTG-motif cell wall-anchored protein